MSFLVESGGSFERCPTGNSLARCYRIIDLGTQKTEYMGQVKYLHKIMLGWEVFPADDNGILHYMRDGRPFSIFKNYTLSWSDKANLRLDLQSWLGKPFNQEELRKFDLNTVMGKWCQLNIIERHGQNGNTYSNVDNIAPVSSPQKQIGFPAAVNANELFNLQDPNMELFDGFSENLKTKIMSSPEWEKFQNKTNQSPTESQLKIQSAPSLDEPDENIPF